MYQKLELIKENEKSSIYKIENYMVKIIEPSKKYVLHSPDHSRNPHVGDEDDNGWRRFLNVEITNTTTNNKSYKRCFQNQVQIEKDVEYDFNGGQMQFNWK